MLLDDAITTRRSIRKFKSDTIDNKDIERVIEAARLTPSAKNRQPWYFYVMNADEKRCFANDLRTVAEQKRDIGAIETSEIIESAPNIIAVYIRGGRTTSDILSIGAAFYGMCLKATDLGLGSLWIGDTDILNDTEKYGNLVGAIALGYPAEFPKARYRKPINEISNITHITSKQLLTDDFASVNVEEQLFVFTSYSHQDKDVVIADIVELKRHGIPVWYDRELEKGAEWDKQALQYISNDHCKVFLFYVTYDSLRSAAVFQEFSTAMKRVKANDGFSILPVLIGEESTSVVLEKLKQAGYTEYAEAYAEYFTYENKLLYICRSINPVMQTHIEEMLAFFKHKNIIANPSIYDSFHYAIKDEKCIITGYSGENEVIVIPEKISGYPVREIGESAFADNKKIRSVIVPSTIKTLSLGAFRATGLENIAIPDSVTDIQTACFRDCISLKHINLPPKITRIAEALFRGCISLEEISVPEGVTQLGEAAFRSCESLTTAIMPSTLKSMTEGGFFGCKSLENLIIPENVIGVERQSFDTCIKLHKVKVGNFIFEKGTVIFLQ